MSLNSDLENLCTRLNQISIVCSEIGVESLLEQINSGIIKRKLNHSIKNKEISLEIKSAFIELIIIGIPTKSIWVDSASNELLNSNLHVNILEEFIFANSFRLQGLSYLKSLEGYSFRDLPKPIQNRIRYYTFSINYIGKSTPKEIRNLLYNTLKSK